MTKLQSFTPYFGYQPNGMPASLDVGMNGAVIGFVAGVEMRQLIEHQVWLDALDADWTPFAYDLD